MKVVCINQPNCKKEGERRGAMKSKPALNGLFPNSQLQDTVEPLFGFAWTNAPCVAQGAICTKLSHPNRTPAGAVLENANKIIS
jgi:hypothetical protein